MSLLSQLKQQKNRLNATTTTIRDPSGNIYQEDSQGQRSATSHSTTLGFIVSNQADDSPAESNNNNSQNVEFEFSTHMDNFSQREAEKRLMWKNQRSKLGDGYSIKRDASFKTIGIFVLAKKPFEEHFDTFSFLLEKCNTVQIDHDDITKRGILETLDGVIFPGGLIFDVEKALGRDGAERLCKFIASGGAYFGVCAGAFLASADGYSGNDQAKKMLGAQTICQMGVGKAEIKLSAQAGQIFGQEFAAKSHKFFWANGPLFCAQQKLHNQILNFELPKPVVLGSVQKFFIKEDPHSSEEKFVDTPLHSQYTEAILYTKFGEGKLLVCGCHPEASGYDTFQSFVENAVQFLLSNKNLQ